MEMETEMEDPRKVRALKPKVKLLLDDYITALVWSVDGSQVVAGTAAGTLYRVDASTAQILEQFPAHALGVTALVSGQGGRVFSGGQDGKLKAWSSGREKPDFEISPGKGPVQHILYGGGTERNILAVAEGKFITFLNTEGRELRPKAELPSTVSGLAWHYQGGILLAASYGGLQVFGVKKGTTQALKTYDWKGAFWYCAWSPDGKWVAGATQEKAVHIWEAETGEHLHMPGYPGKVKFIGWSRDGQWLVTAAAMDLLLWDCSGDGPCGRQPKQLMAHGDTIASCALQHQGSLFASGDESGRLILWDARQPGEDGLIAAFPGESEIGATAWSPDDKVLAAGSADGSLYLF